MIGYVKSVVDFTNIYMLEVENYNYAIHSIYSNVSTFTVVGEYSNLDGNFMIFNEFLGIITSCEPADGRTVLKCERIETLFNRDLLFKEPANSIEQYIYRTIIEEYRDLSDTVYALPYLEVTFSTTTKYSKPVNDNGVYTLEKYFSRVRRLFNVYVDFSVENNKLKISIERRTPGTHNVDFNMSDFQLYEEKYSDTQIAKVTTYNKNVQTDYYMFTDGTFSTNPEEKERAEGKWVILETDDIDDVADEFAKNNSSHSIQFYSTRKLNFYDRVVIRSNGRVTTSYVAQIIRSSADDRYLYKSGDEITTASAYIRNLSSALDTVSRKVEYNTVSPQALNGYVGKEDMIEVAQGGTGAASFPSDSFLLGNGTSAFQAKTADEVVTLLGAVKKPVLLWENASPTSAFSNQSLDLENNQNYSFFLVELKSKAGKLYSHLSLMPNRVGYDEYLLALDRDSWFGYRHVAVTNTGLVFYNGGYVYLGELNESSNNNYGIPTNIWGV